VETVTVVLILLGLRWLPPRSKEAGEPLSMSARLWRTRDAAIAIAAGGLMATATYAMLVHPQGESISSFFLLNALSGGGGSNVVNVLLVDFRSFDTFGEVTVLAVVALTVYALLRRFRPAPESIAIPVQRTNDVDPAVRQTPAEQALSGYMMVPGVYLRFLLPFMGLVTAFFFMRGHNLPGGGFVAGLIFAVGFILQYMLAGTSWVESHLRLAPNRWLAWGLTVAGLVGVGAWFFGYPFLTTHTAHLDLPLFGEVHVPSAIVFDLGVFMVVVGSTLLILVALAHQSIRSHRAPAGGERADIRKELV
jgi:multicomponent K+:H+ antiporter subunit A